MNLRFTLKSALLMLGLILKSGTLLQAFTVLPNDPHVLYSGRIDDSRKEAVVFAYSGTRVRMAFEGDSVGVYLRDLHRRNWIVVFLDGERIDKLPVDGEAAYYELANDLGPGVHTIEIIKATEGNIGNLSFEGFELAEGGRSLPWPVLEDRRIEFIGDSITCGYGIEAADETQSFNPDEENFCDTYAFHTIRNLNADYLVVARSGIGMLRNYNGPYEGSPSNMPAIYDQTLFKSSEPKWDSSRFIPDVVCINLCTNDFSTSGPDVEKFERNYIEFVHRIQAQYPDANIVCLLGPMTTAFKIQEILERVATKCSHPRSEVTFFKMSQQGALGYGADYHPSSEQAALNGAELTAYLRELMGWD